MHQKHVLPNGVRIVTEEIDYVRSVAIGIWVGTGSRNETEGYEGISHFIEHMLFKGTESRTALDLAQSLEAVGGQLNAFTTKEMTCYFAKVLDEDTNLAIDVLSDMFFNSRFDPNEINKEKNVVVEEIKMYQDTPDELIHDLFSQYVWSNHPLGKPILGVEKTVQSLDREKIMSYLDQRYTPDQVVIAVAGKIRHEDIIRQLERFGGFERPSLKPEGEKPQGSVARSSVGKETEQMHIIMGVPGLGQDDEDMYALNILNNVLGGGLGSRLFQEIREQRSLAYSVYSYHSTYADTGLFAVYAGASPANTKKVINCVLTQMNILKTKGITRDELTRTKAQIKGNLYLGLESVNSRMSRLGKTELSFGRVKTAEEAVEKMEKVTLDDVQRVINRLWVPESISILTLGPKGSEVDFDDMIRNPDSREC